MFSHLGLLLVLKLSLLIIELVDVELKLELGSLLPILESQFDDCKVIVLYLIQVIGQSKRVFHDLVDKPLVFLII